MQSLTLKIPSMVDNIRIVESFIDNARDKYNLNDDIYGNIMVAVTESVNNAIQHGNKHDKDKNVTLTLDLESANVSFTVEDEGVGFDYNNLPDPTAPDRIEDLGGRGIYLVKHLADEVTFGNEGKKIKMTFYTM